MTLDVFPIIFNKPHRADGPAIQYPDGTEAWYFDGKRHRPDGPAIEYSSGTKEWYIDGKRHRHDGPAIEYPSGTKEWYLDGKLHRVNGPAIEYSDGTKVWYFDGKRHRVDGPAVEHSDGMKWWYLNGKHIKQSDYYALLKLRKFRSKVFVFNQALNFNLTTMLNLSRNKAVVEWYYSPDNGGGKLAKKRIDCFVGHL